MAERDAAEARHELRNAIVGLSGAAHLIARGIADAEVGLAMRAELDRLRHLVDGPAGVLDPSEGYAIRPVLHALVLLHRSGGADIELDAPADLHASGSGLDLSQAVVNPLVNCSRHAPGSPVRVRARADGRFVRIEVSDRGPGLGVDAGTGSRVRLSISRQLIRAQGGDLWLQDNADGEPGCIAVISVPEFAVPTVASVVIPAQGASGVERIAVDVA